MEAMFARVTGVGRRVVLLMLVLATWGGLAIPAQASRFRSHYLVSSRTTVAAQQLAAPAATATATTTNLSNLSAYQAWDGYYYWALGTHALKVQFPTWLRKLAGNPNVSIANTYLSDYLSWRQSLAPARFNYYHPDLIPSLAAAQTALPPSVVTPITSPQETVPPVVPPTVSTPEPPTALIAACMIAAAIWARGRRRQLA